MPRTAVIFGALSAIGHAKAEAFARQGALLVVAARDVASLGDVASRCCPLGTEAIPVSADAAKREEVAALAHRAVVFGGIDVWVSNVGTGAVSVFYEVPLEAQEPVIRANLIGHMNDVHAAIPICLQDLGREW